MPDYVALLTEAKRRVRASVLWQRFIAHTPLENDIAVWMADFASEQTPDGPCFCCREDGCRDGCRCKVEPIRASSPDMEDPRDRPGCRFSTYGRGDCEHAVGLPAVLNQETTDAHGKPLGWCWWCWHLEQLRSLQSFGVAWNSALDALLDVVRTTDPACIDLRWDPRGPCALGGMLGPCARCGDAHRERLRTRRGGGRRPPAG